MLKARVLSAALLGPLVLGAVYAGGPLFSLVVLLAMVIGIHELSSMLSRRHLDVHLPVAYLASFLLVLAAHALSTASMLAVTAMATLASLTLPVLFRKTPADALATLFTIMYVPFLLSHMVLLRGLGLWFAGMAIAITWACDVFAYFGGVALGRHKMCPGISPKKSWEGAFTGLVASVVASYVIGPLAGLDTTFSLLVGLCLGTLGQVGDLVESAIKRYAAIKDSGALIPGHGGLLDRFDSLLFNGPLLYYLIVLLR